MQKLTVFLALLAVGVFLFGCLEQQQQPLVKEVDARNFVNDDLKSKYQDAEIREIIELNNVEESWQVKARVTYNYSTRCPVRINVYYDYPKKGFVATPPEYITRDCTVCRNTDTCIIGTPEEAIIASHYLNGTDMVKAYLVSHSSGKPSAQFYSEYVDTTGSNANGTRTKDVWVVRWLSPTTNFGVFVMISQKAEILKVWEVSRSEII